MRLHRAHIIHIAFVLVGLMFLIRLFFMQVVSDTYKLAADKNIIQRVVEYPYRGVIYDRYGDFLAYNVPSYDLIVIPKAVKHLDVAAFCQDFGITLPKFDSAMKKAKAYSYVKPSIFISNISQETWAKTQDHMAEYLGFFVQARTARQYPKPMLANTLGYVGAISAQQLAADTTHHYKQGDMLGISGLEASYEKVLRGVCGIRYQVHDAQGRARGSFKGGAYDHVSVPGENLTTTIDSVLQRYGEQLMDHKLGSIVAIAPQTGEILALVSSPSYDPNLLTGGDLGNHFVALEQNKLAPFFHRPIMAMYSPGSILKPYQALIALQEKVLLSSTAYDCNKKLRKCHPHPAPVNLHNAIKYSCNPYFYHVFRNIINPTTPNNADKGLCLGLATWCNYLKRFGLGTALGIDIPGEKRGYVPDAQFYDQHYGKGRWKASTIRSLDIGQGELLVTPLQMANLVAILANRGYYYTPHVVKQIGAQPISPQEEDKHELAIDRAHFECIANAMQEVVEGGTAWRARIKGISICAKTGTTENPHGKDHSVCIAFAPKENPQIAIAVCVENAGWGSRAATAIASLLIEQYLKGDISRLWIHNYVLRGDFFH